MAGRRFLATAGALAALLVAPSTAAAAAPSGLRVVDVRASGATLTWRAPADGRAVYGYNLVDVDNPAVNNGVGFSFGTTGDARLEPNRTYRLAVIATYEDGGESARSSPVTVTTPRDTTPPPAPSASEFHHTATSVTLGWTAGFDDVGVESFIISNGSGTWTVPAWHQWWRTVTDLPTNRTHTFTIRARDAAGNLSPPSNAVSVLIEDVPPSAPRNLREGGEGLVWDPASDNSGAVAGYWVFVDGATAPLNGVFGLTSPLRVWDDSLMELVPAPGTHTYTVRARDPSGNLGPPSNPLTVVVR
jgi:hypothetical protein